MLPPPAPVTMLFDSARPEGPSLPNPDVTVSAPEVPPDTDLPLPEPPMPAIPEQPAVAPVQPVAPQPAPPVIEPTEPAPAAALPVPPPEPPAAPRARHTERPNPAPPHPSAVPAPMNYSLGTPLHPPAPSHDTALAGLAMGPAARGREDLTPFGEITGSTAGPDWGNALSDWVHRHAYYPSQAVQNDESGDSTVTVVTQPNGRVTSVELEERSGSPWLDMALMALFRDAHLPPLPPNEKEPMTFRFTMRYRIIHR